MPSPAHQARLDANARRAEAEALKSLRTEPPPLPTLARTSPVVTFTPDLIDECIALGGCGLSDAETAAHWAISTAELYAMAELHAPLAMVLTRARTAAEAWWERKARDAVNLKDNRFPAGAWAMVMRARFANYRERVEVNTLVDVTQRLVLVDARTNPEPKLTKRPSGRGASLTARQHLVIDGESRPVPTGSRAG